MLSSYPTLYTIFNLHLSLYFLRQFTYRLKQYKNKHLDGTYIIFLLTHYFRFSWFYLYMSVYIFIYLFIFLQGKRNRGRRIRYRGGNDLGLIIAWETQGIEAINSVFRTGEGTVGWDSGKDCDEGEGRGNGKKERKKKIENEKKIYILEAGVRER